MKTTRSIICYALSFLFYLPLLAAEGDYAVSKIPAFLSKNAHAIKRMERVSFEVVNTGEAVLKKKYAITIMNENGDRHAGFVEYYDKLHEIRNIEGTLYDATGKELKKLRNKQIIDLTGGNDNNLMDDNRWKFHNFFYKVYPYTIEYEVEIKYNGTLFFPLWLPRLEENYSVEQSSISIISPADYTVRYKSFNYKGDPLQATMEKGKKMMTWETKDLPAIEDEYASPDWFEMNTSTLFGPTEFEIEKYKGNMNSWQDFGKFVYSLKQGRDELPDNIKKAVHEIADKITGPREKIAKLYQYMQQNTRYISIQLGIGGWQPFDAKYVANKSYGDCKALSNYMFSILKEVGINSFYTLVKAGKNATGVIADFPSQQFNHVILCVPLQKDTVWLECTSQTLAAGYISEFTSDRYALLVDENGGRLVRTPVYGLKDNQQLRKIKAVLDEDGTLSLNALTRYSGLQQDDIHGMINHLSKDKVKEYLHEQLDFATYDIGSFTYTEDKNSIPVIEESLDITVSNYATMTGKRLFIVPNVMTRNKSKLSANEARKYDMVFTVDYRDVDSVEIVLPEGYTGESMPQDVSVNSKFGKYINSVKLSGNKLFYYRSIERYAGRFPAKDYAELVKFYETIHKADRNKVVLVKPEEKKGF